MSGTWKAITTAERSVSRNARWLAAIRSSFSTYRAETVPSAKGIVRVQ